MRCSRRPGVGAETEKGRHLKVEPGAISAEGPARYRVGSRAIRIDLAEAGNGFNLGNVGVHCCRWLQAAWDHRRIWWS
jgi:hypothetical protein